jgi:fused signal recognition particle receptor
MASWMSALAKTRDKLAASLRGLFDRGGAAVDEESLEALEETLLQADVPVQLIGELLDTVERGGRGKGATRREAMRELLLGTLTASSPVSWTRHPGPLTILIVGVNGSGKTTTTAKLAHHAAAAGARPLLAAADTFRAAGSEQLRVWGARVGCDVVGGASGADAAAVAYDALAAAKARGNDVLLVDTAGRMHTKGPLMQELRKVSRSLGKGLSGAPHHTWMVLDATIGQNALHQAREFHAVVPLTGVVVAKLDGSSKAGFLFGVSRELGVPILFAGLGEQEGDLAPFEAAAFVDALLGLESAAAGRSGG